MRFGMKTSLKAGLFGVLALASFAPAAYADGDAAPAWGPFTAGVSLTSDYRFRGLSNSDRDAAIQGWVEYDHESGFFANIWSSNIDFNDAGLTTKSDSRLEVDWTLGYNHAFSDTTKGTVKAVYYSYPEADILPGAHHYSYFEGILAGSHDFGKAAVSGEIDWSPDYFGETGDSVSIKGGVTVPLMDKFAFMNALSASANVGYQWIDDNTYYGVPDYLYFDVGATASWEIFSFDVRWVDTDIDHGKCFPGTPDGDFCEGGVVLTVSANLPG
jgi:uncharacterized protein (TIGR02001 family)